MNTRNPQPDPWDLEPAEEDLHNSASEETGKRGRTQYVMSGQRRRLVTRGMTPPVNIKCKLLLFCEALKVAFKVKH